MSKRLFLFIAEETCTLKSDVFEHTFKMWSPQVIESAMPLEEIKSSRYDRSPHLRSPFATEQQSRGGKDMKKTISQKVGQSSGVMEHI